MTFSIQQMTIAALVLVGSTVLAFVRIINPDAVIALYSAVLGAVLNSTLPKTTVTPAPSPVTVVNQPTGESGEGEIGMAINILLIIILVIVIFKLLG